MLLLLIFFWRCYCTIVVNQPLLKHLSSSKNKITDALGKNANPPDRLSSIQLSEARKAFRSGLRKKRRRAASPSCYLSPVLRMPNHVTFEKGVVGYESPPFSSTELAVSASGRRGRVVAAVDERIKRRRPEQ